MTQYFKAVNDERKEFLTVGRGSSPRHLLYGDNPNKLAYLLLDGPADGTNFANVPLSELPESEVRQKKETIKDRYDSQDRDLTESAYYDAEAGWIEKEMARVVAAGLPITGTMSLRTELFRLVPHLLPRITAMREKQSISSGRLGRLLTVRLRIRFEKSTFAAPKKRLNEIGL